MMNSRIRLGMAVTGITVAALALTGCSLPGTIPLGSPPVLIGDATQDSTDRSASISGSRLCVINNSTLSMSILWQGYPDARDIPVGERNCNSGYETDHKNDVSAIISYAVSGDAGKLHEIKVAANNNWLWPPEASAAVRVDEYLWKGVCHSFDVGGTRFVETGWLRGAMTRINDSADNKEFELTLTDKLGEIVGSDCY
jgi:hypothetical protein